MTLIPGVVFTTARVRHGKIRRLAAHRKRLRRDCAFVAPTLSPLIEDAFSTATAAAHDLGEGRIRIALDVDGAIITPSSEARAEWSAAAPPMKIDVLRDPRWGAALWTKACDRSAVEDLRTPMLLLGPSDEVREGAWFHIAIDVDGSWVTPALGLGVIFGVTRDWFMRVSDATERSLSLDDVRRSRAVVALSSLVGVIPISHVGDEEIAWTKATRSRVDALAAKHRSD